MVKTASTYQNAPNLEQNVICKLQQNISSPVQSATENEPKLVRRSRIRGVSAGRSVARLRLQSCTSRKRMNHSKKIRVALIGAGNCASSLVQGVNFYREATEGQAVPGLMHVNLGGYHVSDIEFTAA